MVNDHHEAHNILGYLWNPGAKCDKFKNSILHIFEDKKDQSFDFSYHS